MILLDANILLYAHDTQSPHHLAIHEWLETLLSGTETVGIPWVSAWAFVRVTTSRRSYERPLQAAEAIDFLNHMVENPLVKLINPGPKHAQFLLEQMDSARVKASETTDAVLAALAIEQGAHLASCDVGFRRFVMLKWLNPLAESVKGIQ